MRRACWLIVAIVAWSALALQLYAMIELDRAGQKSLAATLATFFSYFTIWTNMLAAVCMTTLLAWPKTRLGAFFSRADAQAAVASYILFVGIAYNVLLRHLWNPHGLSLVADELLHDIVPVLYIAAWFAFAPKRGLSFLRLPRWLIYPIVYLLFALVRGSVVHKYPYPFVDVSSLGLIRVLANAGAMIAGFLLLSAGFVAAGRYALRRRATASHPNG